MSIRTTIGTCGLMAAIMGAGIALAASPADALPSCGGNAKVTTTPVDCTSPTRNIGGYQIRAELRVTDAGMATVTYTLARPADIDLPIRVRWHDGISSGPLAAESSGVIRAGATTAILVLPKRPPCDGQIDVKFLFVGNGDSRGRVVAPYIRATLCTTTAPSTAPTTPAPVTTPGPTSSTVTTVPSSAGAGTTATVLGRVVTLPVTGNAYDPGAATYLGLVVIAGGLILGVRKVHVP